jgi:uncharacterized FlaG/YvyC family protein
MQITNIQPSEFHPVVERLPEKVNKPDVKVKKDLEGNVSQNKSDNLSEITSVLDEGNISLSFSQDETTKALVVKLIDKITGEEIRQIPTEVSLKLVAINAKLQGNFFDKAS